MAGSTNTYNLSNRPITFEKVVTRFDYGEKATCPHWPLRINRHQNGFRLAGTVGGAFLTGIEGARCGFGSLA